MRAGRLVIRLEQRTDAVQLILHGQELSRFWRIIWCVSGVLYGSHAIEPHQTSETFYILTNANNSQDLSCHLFFASLLRVRRPSIGTSYLRRDAVVSATDYG
jgi:hypothetical protein